MDSLQIIERMFLPFPDILPLRTIAKRSKVFRSCQQFGLH